MSSLYSVEEILLYLYSNMTNFPESHKPSFATLAVHCLIVLAVQQEPQEPSYGSNQLLALSSRFGEKKPGRNEIRPSEVEVALRFLLSTDETLSFYFVFPSLCSPKISDLLLFWDLLFTLFGMG